MLEWAKSQPSLTKAQKIAYELDVDRIEFNLRKAFPDYAESLIEYCREFSVDICFYVQRPYDEIGIKLRELLLRYMTGEEIHDNQL